MIYLVINDINISANELNNDLKKVSNWTFQWKMSFNPDPSKQVHRGYFQSKIEESNTPSFGL